MIPETIERIKNSERAVSPVIGVILMVAITVILAAVIAAFVLGFGADQDSAPQATWSISETDDASDFFNLNDGTALSDDAVIFAHQGGDSVDVEHLRLGGAEDVTADTEIGTSSDGLETLRAGDSIAFEVSGFNGQEVSLIWDPPGDDSSVLRTFTLSDD